MGVFWGRQVRVSFTINKDYKDLSGVPGWSLKSTPLSPDFLMAGAGFSQQNVLLHDFHENTFFSK